MASSCKQKYTRTYMHILMDCKQCTKSNLTPQRWPTAKPAVTISTKLVYYKIASFQKEAMRTQVALWLFYEVKFV